MDISLIPLASFLLSTPVIYGQRYKSAHFLLFLKNGSHQEDRLPPTQWFPCEDTARFCYGPFRARGAAAASLSAGHAGSDGNPQVVGFASLSDFLFDAYRSRVRCAKSRIISWGSALSARGDRCAALRG